MQTDAFRLQANISPFHPRDLRIHEKILVLTRWDSGRNPHRNERATIFHEAKLHYPQILNSKDEFYLSSVDGDNNYLDSFSKL